MKFRVKVTESYYRAGCFRLEYFESATQASVFIKNQNGKCKTEYLNEQDQWADYKWSL